MKARSSVRAAVYVLSMLGFSQGDNSHIKNAKAGTIYPQESETRELKSLDGIWNFRVSPPDNQYGFKHYWYKDDLAKTGPVEPMPVPSSYNDITNNGTIKDHAGLVWYDKKFFIPNSWGKSEGRVWLRFGSVHYAAKVYVNGAYVMQHEIGHLPFETEITSQVNFGVENRVTVICDNTLNDHSIPQGYLLNDKIDGGTRLRNAYSFDFFNYAGIHRPVYLYTTPNTFIDDIIVNTHIHGTTGVILFNVIPGGYTSGHEIVCKIEVFDKNNTIVTEYDGLSGSIEIPNANFWWPYLMHDEPGYMYQLKVTLIDNTAKHMDIYRQKVGIRTVSWTNTSLLINGVETYLKGFGRHEDSDIRGKGLDFPTIVKDYNLIKWIGANSFRTSHYPYAEEQYDFADENGIMIIDECSSVNTDLFDDALLENHMNSLTKLIKRDKNRPSVIMWSIANEPYTSKIAAESYFEKVANHVRSIDTSRPITIAIATSPISDRSAKHLDIIGFNKYFGWYTNDGRLDMITSNLIEYASVWHNKHNKPVMMMEYGADTMPGLHTNPPFIWSEEYQVQLMSQHFKAFDELRKLGFFIGEHIWNFADFQTDQTYTRVGGNKKGIFTRQRQPKASAHHLRKRYHLLSLESEGVPPPEDIEPYVSSTFGADRSEL